MDVNCWIGKGSKSGLHFDQLSNLLCCIVGARKAVLVPPEDSALMYPHVEPARSHASRIPAEDVEDGEALRQRHPDFLAATRHEAFLDAGDALYIPPRWWHYIRSFEMGGEPLSAAVNFWWM